MNVAFLYDLNVRYLIACLLWRKDELRDSSHAFCRRQDTGLPLIECYKVIIVIYVMLLGLGADLFNVELWNVNRPLSCVLLFLLC